MVKLSETTTSFGRNGTLNTIAIDINKNLWNDGKSITIYPITSRNQRGRCSIEIPTADIPKLIEELQAQYITSPAYKLEVAKSLDIAKSFGIKITEL